MCLPRILKNKKLSIFFSILFAITLLSIFLFFYFPKKNPYARIPVIFLPHSKTPHVEAKVEGIKCLLGLDLGSSSALHLTKNLIEQLHKDQMGKVTWFDMRNNRYENLTYLIDKLTFAKVTVSHIKAWENDLDRSIKGSILSDEDEELEKEKLKYHSGMIGRQVLLGAELLLDFQNGVFFFIRNLDALKKEGYSIQSFIDVPFDLEKVGVVFSIDTDMGIKRFILDSGASISLIKPCGAKDKIIKKGVIPFITTSKFSIGEIKVGSMDLYLFELPEICENVDGILGMDFLSRYAVYLNAKEKNAKIALSILNDSQIFF